MKALLRVLILMLIITGLAFSAAPVGAQQSGIQQVISQMLFGLNPQWAQVPGAPGVQYAPNTNADLFRYENRYYYQHEGNWYRGSNFNGPWERVQDVPRGSTRSRPLISGSPQDGPRGIKRAGKGTTCPRVRGKSMTEISGRTKSISMTTSRRTKSIRKIISMGKASKPTRARKISVMKASMARRTSMMEAIRGRRTSMTTNSGPRP